MSSPIRPPLWITEADGNPSGRPINKIVVSNGTLTINGTTAEITTGGAGGGGTVTNVVLQTLLFLLQILTQLLQLQFKMQLLHKMEY